MNQTSQTWTKSNLFRMMTRPGIAGIIVNGQRGVLQGIEREDGSGSCFNLRVKLDSGSTINVFVRTVD